MICTDCATAADQRAGRDQHCTDPGCTCGHRADRYRCVTGYDVIAAQYAGLAAIADQTAEVHPRTAVRPIGEPFRFPPMISYLADGEDPEEPFAIPSHVLGIYQAQADDAQAHAAAVEAAIADRATEARLRPARERPKLSGGPDAPPCKAAIEGVGPYPASVHYCHLVAGHYDEADEPDFDADPPHPGGWHDDEFGGIWSDLAEGATPHSDTTPEQS